MGLLHSAGGWCALASSLGGELLSGRLASGRFTGGLLGTSHFEAMKIQCGAHIVLSLYIHKVILVTPLCESASKTQQIFGAKRYRGHYVKYKFDSKVI